MDRRLLRPPRPDGSVLWKRLMVASGAAVLILWVAREQAPGFFLLPPTTAGQEISRPLPEFTSGDPDRWLNSPPLTVQELRGQVVFLDVWTFG